VVDDASSRDTLVCASNDDGCSEKGEADVKNNGSGDSEPLHSCDVRATSKNTHCSSTSSDHHDVASANTINGRTSTAAPPHEREPLVERGKRRHINESAVCWVQFLNTASFMSASVARMQVRDWVCMHVCVGTFPRTCTRARATTHGHQR
jgi:hypothetical protein